MEESAATSAFATRAAVGVFSEAPFHLTESVYKVVLQESIPAQIRQHVLYISNYKG